MLFNPGLDQALFFMVTYYNAKFIYLFRNVLGRLTSGIEMSSSTKYVINQVHIVMASYYSV